MNLHALKKYLKDNSVTCDVMNAQPHKAILRVGPDSHQALLVWAKGGKGSFDHTFVFWPEEKIHPHTRSVLKRIVPSTHWMYEKAPELVGPYVAECIRSGYITDKPAA